MPGLRTALMRAGAVVLLAFAPIGIHFAVVTGKWPVLVFAIPAAQLVVIGTAMLVRPASWRRWIIGATVVVLVSLVFAEASRHAVASLPGIPHALAYSSLLVGFGLSLRPGREAVLTGIATRLRGPLPPGLHAYTRHVTAAWCCFFAAQLALSLTLFLFAPLNVWSLFINVLNLPLVVTMFAIEYLYRVAHFPNYRHDRLSDFVKFAAEVSKRASRQADSA